MATKQELAERDADVLQALKAAHADIGVAVKRDGIMPHMKNRRGLSKAMVESSLDRLAVAKKVKRTNAPHQGLGRPAPAYLPL